MTQIRFLMLSEALTPAEGQPLPTEFRLFNAGTNHTERGEFTFDRAAAEAVIADFNRRGVDLMVDLEHDSLSKDAKLLRSDAADARGWFGLEVKPDGSLWAVNVSWASDGEARLRDKRQRYISPAFTTSRDSSGVERPTRIVNAALCARPATFQTPSLIAASSALTLRDVDQRAKEYILDQKRKTKNGSR